MRYCATRDELKKVKSALLKNFPDQNFSVVRDKDYIWVGYVGGPTYEEIDKVLKTAYSSCMPFQYYELKQCEHIVEKLKKKYPDAKPNTFNISDNHNIRETVGRSKRRDAYTIYFSDELYMNDVDVVEQYVEDVENFSREKF